MKTTDLLAYLPIKIVTGELPETITDIAIDSRSVEVGSAFICIKGYTVDGHEFAEKAVESGAKLLIVERDVDVDTKRVAVVKVPDTKRAISFLAAPFFNHPSKKMTMYGVTGTNGKTSVSGILLSLLYRFDQQAAASGTIGFEVNGTLYDSANTTSDVLTTQRMIHQAASENCSSMVMEVSSHGLVEGRLTGVEFDVAIFTNLTHDHLDYHGTMERYGQAKGLLFAQLGQDLSKRKCAVLNNDDEWSERYKEMTYQPILTYGIHREADFRAANIEVTPSGISFTLHSPEGEYEVKTNLLGEFNVYNVLASIAALYATGYPIEKIVEHVNELQPIKGRMQRVQTELPINIYIDYAHTPDAIEKAIAAIKPSMTGGKLIFLIGTGGNRDRSKRPIMAEKASVADYVILTTDDPRYEEYDSIVNELAAGMTHQNYACIGDRDEAVKHAIEIADAGDTIIFAGKGHEDYQIVGNTKLPHSDTNIALQAAIEKFQTFKK